MKQLTLPVLAVLFGLTAVSCSNDIAVTNERKASKSKAVATKKSSFYPSSDIASVRTNGSSLGRDKHGMPTYAPHQRKRYVRTTAYSHMENEPGAPGRKNAMGTILKYGSTIRSAAADWSHYPAGTKFKIKGLPYTYVVDDYGSALAGTNTVDIFHPTLRQMNRWGTRKVEINVIQWGDIDRSLALLKGRVRHKHCRKMYYGLLARKAAFFKAKGRLAANN